jgi:hypothetical protein
MEKGIIARDPNPPNRDPTRRNECRVHDSSVGRNGPLTAFDQTRQLKPTQATTNEVSCLDDKFGARLSVAARSLTLILNGVCEDNMSNRDIDRL